MREGRGELEKMGSDYMVCLSCFSTITKPSFKTHKFTEPKTMPGSKTNYKKSLISMSDRPLKISDRLIHIISFVQKRQY